MIDSFLFISIYLTIHQDSRLQINEKRLWFQKTVLSSPKVNSLAGLVDIINAKESKLRLPHKTVGDWKQWGGEDEHAA